MHMHAQPTIQNVENYFNLMILPVLQKYGATVTQFDPESHLKAKEMEVFYPLTMAKGGQEIKVNGREFHEEKIGFLLSHWDKVQSVLASLMAIESPFHSDIYRHLKDAFPHTAPYKTQLTYSFLCDQLGKAGKVITSD